MDSKTKKLIGLFNVLIIVFCFSACSANQNEIAIVNKGKPVSVIITPPQLNSFQKDAIDNFRNTIFKSTGAEIPVIQPEQVSSLPAKTARIIIGPCPLAEQLGCNADDLKSEEFCIRTIDNNIVILAHDIKREQGSQDARVTRGASDSRVISWAFSYLLDHFVGVRWLWPGELGTVIPKHETISIPELDVRIQQKVLSRSLRNRDPIDVNKWNAWTNHHQVSGRRINYQFGHSFIQGGNNGDWYGRFHLTKPEMLAKDPSGKVYINPNHMKYIKICLSNPDVTKEIVSLWEKAGMPDFWNVAPNDGSLYFCTCDNCQALDLKYSGVKYTKEQIWSFGQYSSIEDGTYKSMTDRYMWFWNQLIRTMREKNPDVKIGVYFYASYRNPPIKLKVEEGIVGLLVPGFDFSLWQSWIDAGAKEIGLRPNWWHMGGCGPLLPLRVVGQFIEKAREAGLVLIDFDSIFEYWAAQGPYYYLVARLIARPDLKTEDIITEYCDAFGPASADIRRYLDYWEEYHKKVAYPIPAGGMISQDPNGLYERICREKFGNVLHPIAGGWRTLPYIYTPEILDQANAILDQAKEKATTEETRLLIEYLKDGLEQVRLSSALIEAPESGKKESLMKLIEFHKERRLKYDYWGNDGISSLRRHGSIGNVDADAIQNYL